MRLQSAVDGKEEEEEEKDRRKYIRSFKRLNGASTAMFRWLKTAPIFQI
jgi:hypothetical protein